MVSRYGGMPGSRSMDQVGRISRTVEDAAITLKAIAGYDARDHYSWDVPVPSFRRVLGTEAWFGSSQEPIVIDGVEKAWRFWKAST